MQALLHNIIKLTFLEVLVKAQTVIPAEPAATLPDHLGLLDRAADDPFRRGAVLAVVDAARNLPQARRPCHVTAGHL